MRTLLAGSLLLLAIASCAPQPAAPQQESPAGAAAWRHKTMVDSQGRIPDGALQRAIAHRAQSAAMEMDNGGIQRGSWRWLGPGNVGGRCRGMWIKPDNADVLVLGSVGGGIWRSADAGQSWEPVADYPASLAIGCMASPQGSKAVIWAGTGEGFNNVDALRGAGIFASYDAGKTFVQLASTTTSFYRYVNRIAFSPTDANTVLVATGSGIARSTDGGTSFATQFGTTTLDIRFHPTDGTKAIAAGDGRSSVRYSTDGGQSWTIATGFPADTGRVELAYAPGDPDTVYASVEVDKAGASSQVLRSTDGGQTYSARNTTADLLDGQGWYDNCIWVDPTNKAHVYVGGVRLHKSTDSGATFTRIDDIHADQHAIVPHPDYDGSKNRIAYVLNDGGIYRTDDLRNASTSSGWTALNNGLGITQFYGGAVSAADRPFGGTQDNGTQQLLSDVWKTFRRIRGADGGKNQADPLNHNVLYGETQYAGVFRSTDGGQTTDSIVNNLTDTGGRDQASWVAAMCLDPNNSDRLWLGTRRVWVTNNVGAATASAVSWTLVFDQPDFFSAITVALGDSDLVFAGEDDGNLYRSTNATSSPASFVQVDGTALPNAFVSDVCINPRNHDQVYVAFGGFSTTSRVWVSDDAKAASPTWRAAGGSGATALPPAPVRALALHPQNEGWIYAGTEVGIFASTDGGQTWSTSNAGPATVSVDELVIHEGWLYAFTHGRGVYRCKIGAALNAGAGIGRVSLNDDAVEGNQDSEWASINGNGRFVAFESAATNFDFRNANGRRNIWVRDRQAGKIELISQRNGFIGDAHSDQPEISGDGRFVAYHSTSTNLVSNDSNSRSDVFVRDRSSGITERVSVRSDGVQGNDESSRASISEDGRWVVFNSVASNLVNNDKNARRDVFRFDRQTDTITRVSVATSNAEGDQPSRIYRRAVSRDGKYVVFSSSATNLVSGDSNGVSDIFLRSYAGLRPTTTRISVSGSGAQANGASTEATISADGRYIAYGSVASNLVANDNNSRRDIFLYDRVNQTTTLLSSSVQGQQSNGNCDDPMIAPDGAAVAWDSTATNLVANDGNGVRDVFLWRRGSKTLERLSLDGDGREADGGSYWASLSTDAGLVAFHSAATNLVTGDTNGVFDVFCVEAGGEDVVFPLEARNTVGLGMSAFPLSVDDLRYQVVVRESQGRVMNIRRLSIRRDNINLPVNAPARTLELDMLMAKGKVDAMTSTFTSNYASTPTEVISRKAFNIPSWSAAPVGLPKFDVGFPLDQPYAFDGQGALLWEARAYYNSHSFPHPADAHQALAKTESSSVILGTGCDTKTGKNMGHNFATASTGTATSLSMGVQRGPPAATCMLALGTTNPKFQVPGWCAQLYTDATLLLPMGVTDLNGEISIQQSSAVPWTSLTQLSLYTQAFSPTGAGFFSYGRRYSGPTLGPQNSIYELYIPNRNNTWGILSTRGVVFKLDY